MKLNTPFRRVECKCHENSHLFETKTDTLGYIPLKRKLDEYILAGQKLKAYREAVSLEMYPEDGSDADPSVPYMDELEMRELIESHREYIRARGHRETAEATEKRSDDVAEKVETSEPSTDDKASVS